MDNSILTEAYQLYYRSLYAYAYYLTGNRADAEELRLSAPFVREVGDCIRAANITKAIYEGYHAALDI